MTFHKQVIALLAIAALSFSATAFAEEHKQTINERQHRQNERIQQGVKSGELTPKEAARLREHRRSMRRYEHRSRKDGGGISSKEAQRMDKMQDKQSKAIYNQKHDEQKKH